MESFAIAIHGGAQSRKRDEISPDAEKRYRKGLEEALAAGWEILNNSGTALDAVEAAVRSLEDSPLFNAGRGSALNEHGVVETDAAIMCGRTLNSGAAGGVKLVKNPVTLARRIMDNSNYAFLCAQGAYEFAVKNNLQIMDMEYFITEERLDMWKKAKQEEMKPDQKDTVGAVALDKNGDLAAATSTGGLTNKLSGRIGDSPVIGSGTYANNEACAVSFTGDGDQILRGVYAYQLFALIKYRDLSLRDAAKLVFETNEKTLKAEMGVIAIDITGNIELAFNTLPMFRACRKGSDEPLISVWED